MGEGGGGGGVCCALVAVVVVVHGVRNKRLAGQQSSATTVSIKHCCAPANAPRSRYQQCTQDRIQKRRATFNPFWLQDRPGLQRDRETGRETTGREKDTHTHTDRQRDYREMERDRQTDTDIHTPTERQTQTDSFFCDQPFKS